MMEELLVPKIAHSYIFFASPSYNWMSVGHAIQFSYRFETMMKSYARGKYDLLGRCDFQPGFAAFDHDYKSFIFLRLSCHQQQQ